MVAISILNKLNLNTDTKFLDTTIMGSLAKYISTENKNFQPMNANFGILKPLDEKIKDKKLRYEKQADIALNSIDKFIKGYNIK